MKTTRQCASHPPVRFEGSWTFVPTADYRRWLRLEELVRGQADQAGVVAEACLEMLTAAEADAAAERGAG